MSDQFPPPPPQDPQFAPPPPPPPPPSYEQPPAPPGYAPPPPPAYAPPPGGYPPAPPAPQQGAYLAPIQYGAPIGKIRSTGTCILLAIVTLGIYTYVWYWKTHDEMKRHTGQGLGGGLAFVIQFLVGITPFFTSSEVGTMQERAGRPKTVSGLTGLWYFPGIFLFFIGPIVWFVKTNGAINDYWRSLGAQG